MYIYRGKLDFAPSDSQNATYEAITTMFPSEFRLGNPVYTCWQWSAFGGSKNVPCWLTGIIDSVDNSDTDGKKIGFYGGHYRFDGFLSGPKGIEELSLVVRSGNVVGTAINTMLIFRPDDPGPTIDQDVIVPRIYLGKLSNYAPYSIDQLLLVVIPRWTVGEGNPVCAFWQWAVDIHDSTKVNVDFTTLKMTNVENVADGVSFRFSDSSGYFAFHATMGLKDTAEHWEREQQQLTLTMTTPYLSTGSLMLELRDLRPSPGGRQPRKSQNEGSSLMHSLVEMGPKIVELTNKLKEKFNDSEQAVRDRDGTITQLESKLRIAELESRIRVAELESQLRVAQLETQLRAAQDENKC